jgi:hypothetical protein
MDESIPQPEPGFTSCECSPKSKWVKGSRRNPLIPRESKR